MQSLQQYTYIKDSSPDSLVNGLNSIFAESAYSHWYFRHQAWRISSNIFISTFYSVFFTDRQAIIIRLNLGLYTNDFAVWSRPAKRRVVLLLGEDPGLKGTEGTPQAQNFSEPCGTAPYSEGFGGGELPCVESDYYQVPGGQHIRQKMMSDGLYSLRFYATIIFKYGTT